MVKRSRKSKGLAEHLSSRKSERRSAVGEPDLDRLLLFGNEVKIPDRTPGKELRRNPASTRVAGTGGEPVSKDGQPKRAAGVDSGSDPAAFSEPKPLEFGGKAKTPSMIVLEDGTICIGDSCVLIKLRPDNPDSLEVDVSRCDDEAKRLIAGAVAVEGRSTLYKVREDEPDPRKKP